MYHELVEELAIVLAQADGWNVANIHDNHNPRAKVYLKMASACLRRIDTFLEDEGIEFDDLDIKDRYQMPQTVN